MPKKQKTYNAFYYFMLDFQRKEESKGNKFASMVAVSAAAGTHWTRLTPEQKRPYEEKAKQLKSRAKEVKYTTLDEKIDDVDRLEKAKREKLKNMEKDIESTINDRLANDEFANIYFYIGYVNYYCYASEKYLPAEIALVRFSLKDGVDTHDVCHSIIDSGDLPIGYRLSAQTHAEETHHIPAPPHTEGDFSVRDIKSIISQILDFLGSKLSPDEPYPPIYVDETNEEVAANVFKHLLRDHGWDETLIKIYNLPYLFYSLRNAAHKKIADEIAFLTKSNAVLELERDIYDFVKGISCPFHSDTDCFQFCSLSRAVRAAYQICDHCCGDLGIDLIPAKHIPFKSDRTLINKRPSSRVSIEWGLSSASSSRNAWASPSDASSVVSSVSSASTSNHLIAASNERPSMRRPVTTSRLFKMPDNKDISNPVSDTASIASDSPFTDDDFPSLSEIGRSLNGCMSDRADSSVASGATKSSFGRGRGRILAANFSRGRGTGAIPKHVN